ncbi:MAG TPA: hypothetical protein VGD91_30510 [Trebonia sp.]
MSEEFRLRSVAVAAFGPATLFGLAEGPMTPGMLATRIGERKSMLLAAMAAAAAVAGLVAGIVVSGLAGFAAAGVLCVFIPRRSGSESRRAAQ